MERERGKIRETSIDCGEREREEGRCGLPHYQQKVVRGSDAKERPRPTFVCLFCI